MPWYSLAPFALLLATLAPVSSAAEKCDVPAFNGLRLGMPAEDLLTQYPNAKKERVSRKRKYYHIDIDSPFEGIEIDRAKVIVNTVKSCVTDVWITLHTTSSGDELEVYFRGKWGDPNLKGSANLVGEGRWPLIGWSVGCGVDISFYRAAHGRLPRLTYTESIRTMNSTEQKPCSVRPPA